MKPTEVVMLTGYLRAHFPSQPVDEYTTEALAELLEPYPAVDCKLAVLNIADRGEKWCSPSDVRAEVRRIRDGRLASHGPLTPPLDMDPDDSLEWRRWLRSTRRAIADGSYTPYAEIEYRDRDVVDELGHVGNAMPDA